MGKLGKPTPLDKGIQVGDFIADRLLQIDGVIDVWICGSVRRRKAVVSDVDVMIVTEQVSLEWLAESIPEGHWTPSSGVLMVDDVRVEFWRCPPMSVGPMMLFLTGPAELNIAMRRMAQRRGLMLSQYVLKDRATDERIDEPTHDPLEDELRLFDLLGMARETPEERSAWSK